MNAGMTLRAWSPRNRFVPVEIRDSGKSSTGMESGNRFVPVEISDFGKSSTGIESRNLTCSRINS